MVHGVLFGHGPLVLDSRSDDYGEVCVYSDGSSPDEPSPAQEESYRIARSLGAASSAQVLAKVDYVEAGLLPGRLGLEFAEQCSSAFVAPEVECDVLSVSTPDLLDAINFHAISVSSFFDYFVCCCVF